MIVVSHDRYFLDKVVTRIWELYEGKIDVYPGNYTQYWKLRTEKAKVLQRQSEKQQDYIADQEAYIRKYGAGPAGQAGPRPREEAGPGRAGRDDARDRRPADGVRRGRAVRRHRRSRPASSPRRTTSRCSRTSTSRSSGASASASSGPNGAGKSTLIKTLIGKVKPDSGEVKLGHKVLVGYHDQGLESLPPETTVLRAVWPEDDPDWVQGDVRDLLARFGLSGELVLHNVGQLSGGEKGKAALARLGGDLGQPAGDGRADQPPRHLGLRRPGAVDPRVRGDRARRLARPLFPQPGGRPDHRRRRRQGPGDRGGLRDLPAPRRPGGRGRRPEAGRRRPPPAEPKDAAESDGKAEKRKRKFPYRKTPDIEREIAEVEAEVAELEDLLGQPATWKETAQGHRHPGPAQGPQGEARQALRALGRGGRAEFVRPARVRAMATAIPAGCHAGSRDA